MCIMLNLNLRLDGFILMGKKTCSILVITNYCILTHISFPKILIHSNIYNSLVCS